ncbi:hypothetical protein [Silvimonas sp.]|uniref:hypothetical protein n=1 Tax=Silvimonas sp. TaxID=2650811 RepID=UPI00284AFBB0|nr:hypothetical protein [Silvimonas sp.]MDR3428080.1 hypothetical protein [Silvimonas sp.]
MSRIEQHIVAAWANRLTDAAVNSTISELKASSAELSGDSGLANVWEEFCAQVQGEESADWSSYEDVVEELLSGFVEGLDRDAQLALWTATEPGWAYLYDHHADQDGAMGVPLNTGDIVSKLEEEVWSAAADYESPSLYRYRWGEDDPEYDDDEESDDEDDMGPDEGNDSESEAPVSSGADNKNGNASQTHKATSSPLGRMLLAQVMAKAAQRENDQHLMDMAQQLAKTAQSGKQALAMDLTLASEPTTNQGVRNSEKVWFPKTKDLTESERSALMVKTAQPVWSAGELIPLLEDKLAALIQVTPNVASLLEMSVEHLPELVLIKQQVNREHWASALARSDSMQILMNKIDWAQEAKPAPARMPTPEPISLHELLEQLG